MDNSTIYFGLIGFALIIMYGKYYYKEWKLTNYR